MWALFTMLYGPRKYRTTTTFSIYTYINKIVYSRHLSKHKRTKHNHIRHTQNLNISVCTYLLSYSLCLNLKWIIYFQKYSAKVYTKKDSCTVIDFSWSTYNFVNISRSLHTMLCTKMSKYKSTIVHIIIKHNDILSKKN